MWSCMLPQDSRRAALDPCSKNASPGYRADFVSAMAGTDAGLRQRVRVHSDRKEVLGDLRDDAEIQLKRFIETNGHFSLVR